MKKRWIIFVIFILFILLVVGVYFTWFFSYSCDDFSCFQARQETCSRASFIRDTQTTVWKYQILGKSGSVCVINAEILKVKEGQLDRKSFEKKSMDCSLPLKSRALPESDLSRCHGLLKEEIQQLIIKNAHAQILANIEKVTAEFEKKELEKVL